MAHIYKLGLENFRVFKKFQEFEFAPITVLTGANNSGKSSVIKGLQLLKEYLENHETNHNDTLDFTKGTHNLGKHEFVVNNKKKPLRIDFPTVMKGINELLIISYEFISDSDNKLGNGKLNSIRIYPVMSNDDIFRISLKNSKPSVYIDIRYFIKKLEETIFNLQENSQPDKGIQAATKFNLLSIPEVKNNLRFHKYPLIDNYDKELLIKVYKNVDILYDSNKLPSISIFLRYLFKERIIERDVFDHICDETTLLEYLKSSKSLTESEISSLADQSLDLLKDYIVLFFENRKWLSDDFSPKSFEDYISDTFSTIFHNNVGVWSFSSIQTEKLLQRSEEENDDFSTDLFAALIKNVPQDIDENLYFLLLTHIGGNIANSIKNSSRYFDQFHLLNAVRGISERIYTYHSPNIAFNDILTEFVRLKSQFDERANMFLKKWFSAFGIDDNYVINVVTEGIGTSIKFGNRSIADLGYGMTQFIPILIKIICIYLSNKQLGYLDNNSLISIRRQMYGDVVDYYSASTLLIEEPESNLHPKLQSLLADLFIDANKEFNIQFIVETHSEYLVRKLQYLTSEGSIKPEDTALYYFYNPNDIPNGEEQVKRITIKENGSLSSGFGSGFFDEADNIAIQLFKLNQKDNI